MTDIQRLFKKTSIFVSSVLLLLVYSCCPKILPPSNTNVNVRDSIVIVYRDSTVIVPIERIVDIVPDYDTLFLSTSLAEARAWVDTTTHSLKGSIQNKQQIIYKYIFKDRIEYRDSIHYCEKPVPYEVQVPVRYVPWIYKALSAIGIIALMAGLIFIVVKFKI